MQRFSRDLPPNSNILKLLAVIARSETFRAKVHSATTHNPQPYAGDEIQWNSRMQGSSLLVARDSHEKTWKHTVTAIGVCFLLFDSFFAHFHSMLSHHK